MHPINGVADIAENHASVEHLTRQWLNLRISINGIQSISLEIEIEIELNFTEQHMYKYK